MCLGNSSFESWMSSKTTSTHLTMVRPIYLVWSFMAFQSWLSELLLVGNSIFVKQKCNHTSDTGMAKISCFIFQGLSKIIVRINVSWKFKFWKLNVKQNYIHTSDNGTANISCLIFHGLSKLIVRIDVCWEFKFWKLNVKQNYIHTSDNGTAEISCLIDWSFLLTLVSFLTFHETLLFCQAKV